MNRIFFIGAMHSIDADPELDTMTLLQRTGNNTGNLYIGHSTFRHLKPEIWSRNMRLDPAQIESDYDVIVIPASNFLYAGFDLGHLADFLEKVKLPCVMIGVGSQAPNYDSEIILQKGTVRFLKIVSERSVSIGARGFFTASWLEKYGIKNVDIIGCPSFFWTCRPTLSVAKKDFSEVSKIALNGSRNVVAHSSNPAKMQRIETALLREALHFDADFFVQNEPQEAFLARKMKGEVSDSLLTPILNYYGADTSDKQVIEFFENHTRLFFDISEWSAAIRSYDFAVGSRFHGNIIALQNGVPAFVIAHDARTQELCELLHLPFLTINDIEFVSLEWLYELADYNSISAVYNQLFNNYIDFLEKNGLKHTLKREVKISTGDKLTSYCAVQRILR